MTLAAILAFVLCFVVGPAICWGLLRLPTRLPVLTAMAALAAAALVMALRLQSIGDVLFALGSMWLAWVIVIALLAKALLKRALDPRARRWITVGALLATTLPWFGLATAEMMV